MPKLQLKFMSDSEDHARHSTQMGIHFTASKRISRVADPNRKSMLDSFKHH